ncbi:MAG TPA: TlpA disulfide reductase family protein, partial [Candidatus Polarisedimenticolia bacterium]|nr:TlpA disulfide reductase family protein [Candidatus Polarisedimenticolia bacterium]
MPLAAILPAGAGLGALVSALHPVTINPMAQTVSQQIPYRFAGPLRRLGGSSARLDSQPFDLQARLGKGKPVALIFWAPEFPDAERALVTLAKFLTKATPQIETYAVSGRRDEQQDEEIWERFAMLDLPPALPLLIDDKFTVSQALTTTDVPDLAVFDGRGALVVAKIKDLAQALVSSDFGNIPAETLLHKLSAGEPVDQIKNMFPYYPASRLVGHCAPSFTARRFNSAESFTFTGRSPAGKPTLVMFWSSTCKHCQQEIPQMVDWVKKHPGVVDIVSVTHLKREKNSDAEHRKVTEAYIREQKIPWLVLEDPDNAINELYESVSTPTTYIVSPGSTISEIWYYAHQGNFGEALEKALGKARAAGATCNPPAARPAPRLDFTVMGPDGKRVPVTSLLDRPALVHFWATWCAPCVAELPSVLRLRDRLEKSGTARVILVSVEDESAGPAIAAFAKKQNLDLRSYRAPSGGLAGKVDLAHRVPRTYLVAAGGQVLGLRQGSQEWDDATLFARVQSRLAVLGGGANGAATPARSAGR